VELDRRDSIVDIDRDTLVGGVRDHVFQSCFENLKPA
jgi:hypothetical protein